MAWDDLSGRIFDKTKAPPGFVEVKRVVLDFPDLSYENVKLSCSLNPKKST